MDAGVPEPIGRGGEGHGTSLDLAYIAAKFKRPQNASQMKPYAEILRTVESMWTLISSNLIASSALATAVHKAKKAKRKEYLLEEAEAAAKRLKAEAEGESIYKNTGNVGS